MGFRINTNESSISAQRSLSSVTRDRQKTLNKLSSGERINSASDDAAGLAISEKMRSSIRSIRQADRNASDSIGLIQTAEGGLNELSGILIRMRELSVQSASDTMGDQERSYSDLEFQGLKEEINRIVKATQFNGIKLLDGEGDDLEFQIGPNNDARLDRIVFKRSELDAAPKELGLVGSEIGSKDGAREGLDVISGAISKISEKRSKIGALQNRMISTSNNLKILEENLSAAKSRIRDTDYAAMTAENTRLEILTTAGSSVLAQTNKQGINALRLLDA